MTNWTRIRTQLGKRGAIVGAGVAGFLVGAGGFVAAQIDDSPSAEVETEVEVENSVDATPSSTTDDSVPTSSLTPTSVDLSVPDVTTDDSTPGTTTDDSTPGTTTDDSVPGTTIDDDDSTSSSVPDDTVDDDDGDDDDSTSSSVPDDTVDDSPTGSVPASLPAAFTRSYQSFGGSIGVTWTGTALVLDSVSPAAGFRAEIEDQAWDRIRVDFEGEGDVRIEVRLNDGQIRVRID